MAIALADIEAYAQRISGLRVGSRVNAIIAESINSAMEAMAKDLDSSRNFDIGTLNIQASYNTGTIAITNGAATVTLSGGTFPTWAASGELLVDGQWYAISTRDSGTQLTLAANWHLDSITGQSYVLYQDAYSLGDSVMELGPEPFYGNDWLWGARPIGLDRLLRFKQYWQSGDQNARYWAFHDRKVYLWPYPTEAQVVYYTYRKLPTRVTYGAGGNLDVDDHLRALLEAAVAVELQKRGTYAMGGSPAADYAVELSRAKTIGNFSGSKPMRTYGHVLREQPKVSGMW